jgi:hypothetical protein
LLSAAVLLALGKGLDWLIKRRAENRTLSAKDEEIEDDRLESIADRYRTLMQDERNRADQIALERDAIVKSLGERIARLDEQIAALKTSVAERDAVISEQATKIARLERQVKQL